MLSTIRRALPIGVLALALLTPGRGRADGLAEPGRPVVIDPQPDWSTKWANKVCRFAQSLAAYDPTFRGGAEAICAFVLGTE